MLKVQYLGKRKMKEFNFHAVKIITDAPKLTILSEGGTKIEHNMKRRVYFALVLDDIRGIGTITVKNNFGETELISTE